MRRTLLAAITALVLTPLISQAQQTLGGTGDLQKEAQNPSGRTD